VITILPSVIVDVKLVANPETFTENLLGVVVVVAVAHEAIAPVKSTVPVNEEENDCEFNALAHNVKIRNDK
jgi:hypothetical protein